MDPREADVARARVSRAEADLAHARKALALARAALRKATAGTVKRAKPLFRCGSRNVAPTRAAGLLHQRLRYRGHEVLAVLLEALPGLLAEFPEPRFSGPPSFVGYVTSSDGFVAAWGAEADAMVGIVGIVFYEVDATGVATVLRAACDSGSLGGPAGVLQGMRDDMGDSLVQLS